MSFDSPAVNPVLGKLKKKKNKKLNNKQKK